MADWVTISSLATAGGTLVLAAGTFASVRSANRASRVAEMISRFFLTPRDDGGWLASAGRHWYLDGTDPRS